MTLGDQTASAMAELIERGAESAVHHDMQVLQGFAHKLRGLGDTLDVDEAIALLPDMKVPEGFCHARYTVYEVTGTGPNGEKLLGEPDTWAAISTAASSRSSSGTSCAPPRSSQQAIVPPAWGRVGGSRHSPCPSSNPE